MVNAADKTNVKDDRLVFEHGWRYFELHANQRISLFRYYIIFFSLYVTGVGFLLIKSSNLPCKTENEFITIASIIFILITIIFWLLDCRNRKLIHIAEASLRKFEDVHSLNLSFKIFTKEKKVSSNTWIRHTCCFSALFIIAIGSACSLSWYSFNHIPNTCKESISTAT